VVVVLVVIVGGVTKASVATAGSVATAVMVFGKEMLSVSGVGSGPPPLVTDCDAGPWLAACVVVLWAVMTLVVCTVSVDGGSVVVEVLIRVDGAAVGAVVVWTVDIALVDDGIVVGELAEHAVANGVLGEDDIAEDGMLAVVDDGWAILFGQVLAEMPAIHCPTSTVRTTFRKNGQPNLRQSGTVTWFWKALIQTPPVLLLSSIGTMRSPGYNGTLMFCPCSFPMLNDMSLGAVALQSTMKRPEEFS
jgi:hypothetical protein